MTHVISTTLTDKMHALAQENHIKWSEALERGIKAMINEPIPDYVGETIEEESLLSKKTQQVRALQNTVDQLDDELRNLREKGNA